MKEWLIGMAVGAIVSFLAARIVAWWTVNKAGVELAMLGVDDWVERKLNLDLPDKWQAWYHAQVAGVVAWVDTTFGDAKSTRQLLRKIVALSEPGKRGALLAELEQLVDRWKEEWGKHLDVATPDLKTAINEAKEDLATRVVNARLQAMPNATGTPVPAEVSPVSETGIRESVRAAAPGSIADHSSEPVTPDLLKRMIEESKLRQARLRANG